MTTFTYENTQFSPVCTSRNAGLVRSSLRKAVQEKKTQSESDWAARSQELLNIFNDDSKPSFSGKFGTNLY